ncbi:MAG: glycerophosphodiester phosphodiesterase [Lachnospiraceae bacterium]|nr:glycerophosphodiester phosphodiesterase [Lachnospiraceae bacterium]
MSKQTKVWAHRGASGYAPENTLAAFQMAADMGADGIELDVQICKSGELVVIHDETIDRVSHGKGYVKDFTLEELKRYTEGRIPCLAEVYELIRPTSLIINTELKTGIFFYEGIEERVLEMEKDMGMEGRIIYSSFNHVSMCKIKECSPLSQTGFLYADGILDIVHYAKKYHADALHPALYNLQYPNFIDECKQNNLPLHVWTVNEVADMKRLCEKGIDAIITNYPDVARKIVEEQ